MSQMFLFYFIFYGGALVFLGGAGAPASPSLAPPMLADIAKWNHFLTEQQARAEGGGGAKLWSYLFEDLGFCFLVKWSTYK